MPNLPLNSNTPRTAANRAFRQKAGPTGLFPSRLISAIGFRISALCLLLLAGCISHDQARKQAQAAYQAGFREGQEAAEAKRTQVFFEGPVQRRRVFWHPDLTLAQAIVEAVYTSPKDPKSIVVTRNGTPQLVDPKNLLRGVDFLLEPGDVVHLIP